MSWPQLLQAAIVIDWQRGDCLRIAAQRGWGPEVRRPVAAGHGQDDRAFDYDLMIKDYVAGWPPRVPSASPTDWQIA